VKILSAYASGSISSVIAGVNYVTNNVTSRPAVACLEIVVSASAAYDDAVAKSIAKGIHYVVPAANENANVCNYSPIRVGNLLVAGATTNTDSKTTWSNIGPCVSLFAPGQSITSDWVGSSTATNTMSSTASSAAFAAGVLAMQLSISPSRGSSFLVSQATPNVISNPGTGSPNLLLFSPVS